jgi:hypothetical protein
MIDRLYPVTIFIVETVKDLIFGSSKKNEASSSYIEQQIYSSQIELDVVIRLEEKFQMVQQKNSSQIVTIAKGTVLMLLAQRGDKFLKLLNLRSQIHPPS